MRVLLLSISLLTSVAASCQALFDVAAPSPQAARSAVGQNMTPEGDIVFIGDFEFDCPPPVFDMPPPPNVTNPTPLTGARTTWERFFGRAFPSQPGDQGIARLGPAKYLAVEFIVPSTGFTPDRNMQGVISITGNGSIRATVAISECMGVVRTAGTSSSRCTSFEADPSFGFTFLGTNFPFSSTRCELRPGQRYFLNIANRRCNNTQCATELSVQWTSN
jgi:hypothetical protein